MASVKNIRWLYEMIKDEEIAAQFLRERGLLPCVRVCLVCGVWGVVAWPGVATSVCVAGKCPYAQVRRSKPPTHDEVPEGCGNHVFWSRGCCSCKEAFTEGREQEVPVETGLLSQKGALCDNAAEEASKTRLNSTALPQTDTSWFTTNKNDQSSSGGLPPNPWLQRLAPAATIDVFDGDPKHWPRFVAGLKSMVHDAVSSDADRLAILSQLLSPRLREGFAGLLYSPCMY
ncbi:hypothetical protein M514_26616 [Trichuris suis]|uniref:Uncharacterized protein n=1 Tax=Trichuris suis TaxID=68888 RepID=A0A085MVD7_9BILA|nr:hypothetical protein M514_26616 [Trichuris suis]